MAARSISGKGKSCAAGAPGKISCANSTYTPGVSMHAFPRDKRVRTQWVKFVRVQRPDFQPSEFSALCSLHFEETRYTRLKLSLLMPADGSEECEGSSIERPETKSKRRKEKRILVKGSVPTI